MTDLGLISAISLCNDWRLSFFARSSVVLRSFFAFKAKNDRRTSVEEAEKHRVSTGVGQPTVMPQGGEWVLLGDT